MLRFKIPSERMQVRLFSSEYIECFAFAFSLVSGRARVRAIACETGFAYETTSGLRYHWGPD